MRKTFVIGISGASGSGKSTFSSLLTDHFPDYRTKIIHMDDYYREESQRPKIKGITDEAEYVDDNHPEAVDLDQCCEDIRQAIDEGLDLLLVEGIFAFWDSRIFSQLDLKIYVDCDSDERFARRIFRHLSFGQHMEEITGRYIQAVQPRQREFAEAAKWKADLIINGFSLPLTGTQVIVSGIREALAKRGSKETAAAE